MEHTELPHRHGNDRDLSRLEHCMQEAESFQAVAGLCRLLSDAKWLSHMERTKVLDEHGRELAMCTWGAISVWGDPMITTYGYPDMIECTSEYLDEEPHAMEIADILIMLAEKEQPC